MRRLLIAALLLSSSTVLAAPDKVVPFDGQIDRNGVPFSGVATMNFGLFACPTGNCEQSAQLLWQASGASTSFPDAGAVGVNVTANGGRFSVLLGDTGQTALPATVWRTPQLHVRIAVKGGTTWVPLTGFQRIAATPTAISAEEAASFTVRQNLTVAGTTTLSGATSAQAVTAASLTATSLSVGTGLATFTGGAAINGITSLNGSQLRLRSHADNAHALQHRQNFANTAMDGPVLFGTTGGALGTPLPERIALSWSTTGVNINGELNRDGEPMFIICSADRVENHVGSGNHGITFTEADCGGFARTQLLFTARYTGVLSNLTSTCVFDFHSVNVVNGVQNQNFPEIRWRGSACNNTNYKATAIYFRK